MKRIRYWYQETTESGRWCLSGAIPDDLADETLALYQRLYGESEIVDSDQTTQTMPQTSREKQALLRQRRKDAGLIRVEVWVQPRDRERVKEYARKLQNARNGQDIES